MSDFSLSRINLRQEQKADTVGEYRRQEKALEEACKQFEGIFLSTMWKDMMKSAKSFGGEEKKNAFAPMEDLAMEMVSEHLSESQGVGMWKVLYDQLHLQIPVPDELKKETKERGA